MVRTFRISDFESLLIVIQICPFFDNSSLLSGLNRAITLTFVEDIIVRNKNKVKKNQLYDSEKLRIFREKLFWFLLQTFGIVSQ